MRGQQNFRSRRRLENRHSPVPSQNTSFTRSALLDRKQKIVPENGSALSCSRSAPQQRAQTRWPFLQAAQCAPPSRAANPVLQMLRCQIVASRNPGDHRPWRNRLRYDQPLLFRRPAPPTNHAALNFRTSADPLCCFISVEHNGVHLAIQHQASPACVALRNLGSDHRLRTAHLATRKTR